MSDLKIRDHRDILLAPVVSEKSYSLLDENTYTFLVAKGSSAVQSERVEAIPGVRGVTKPASPHPKAREL